MLTCKSCGKNYPDGTYFCEVDGTRLIVVNETPAEKQEASVKKEPPSSPPPLPQQNKEGRWTQNALCGSMIIGMATYGIDGYGFTLLYTAMLLVGLISTIIGLVSAYKRLNTTAFIITIIGAIVMGLIGNRLIPFVSSFMDEIFM